ncbi:head scaffolding protein [Arthrobacter phage Liebe]|uniref:Scaffolding protein n=2 Tax=Arthrobacter virus Liebe TaxID=2734245 RepID=A0A3G2KHN2_9CAUD|nr:head scaffolding protein [Arthrobacter phage Liebe]AYN58486.1 scaffolding protein [Arthrobacter phage Maureen]AZF93738.1 scaffolding protein [Arthrobacter phage Liebe]
MADTEKQTEQTDQSKEQTPPWGDDFDAERAWRLVQNLRGELADVKTERDAIKRDRDAVQTERDQLKDGAGSESEKVTAAEKRAADAERALHVERALRKHPDLADYADLLTGDTEEEIVAKADRLAAIGKKGGDPAADDKDQPKAGAKPDADASGDDDGLPGKPTPDLKPGHGGAAKTPFDAEAIAKAARAAKY